MNTADWNAKFGEHYFISLTNEERRYFGLDEIDPAWEKIVYYSKTNLWYTRVTVFFDADTIRKTITETKRVIKNTIINYERYYESDTRLLTIDRNKLIPLTSRGKIKPLNASNINSVTPFGCSFFIAIVPGRDTVLYIDNARACKSFALGEWDKIEAIQSDDDFHTYALYYIDSCRDGYFEKLQAFRSAEKETVKYKTGDIFRMEYDRTHYCYGIITGIVKHLRDMPEMTEKDSLRQLMLVPLMVRLYQIITEAPALTAKELQAYPLGRVMIRGDNDIIWGKHAIVDHKKLEASDLEFNFVCAKIVSYSPHTTLFTQEFLMGTGLMPKQEYQLYIEWGFTHTTLTYNQLSDTLKQQMEDYSSPHGGILMGIDPRDAIPDSSCRRRTFYRYNLLNPENRDILTEIFSCLGMVPDTTFDQFAQKFGGLSSQEIVNRIARK